MFRASGASGDFSEISTIAEDPARAEKSMACVHFATIKATILTRFMTSHESYWYMGNVYGTVQGDDGRE
jgi:hypothetical protein